MRREPVIERQVNPIGSVVTLTAELNFPADLRSNDERVTIVGTETKKITLESRFNTSVIKPTLSDCTYVERVLDRNSDHLPVQITEIDDSRVDSLKIVHKANQKKGDSDIKTSKKVLAEVDGNISYAQRKIEERESVVEVVDKKGKLGKAKRKVSKGEKSKNKSQSETKSMDEIGTSSNNMTSVEVNLPITETNMPVFQGILQGAGDIEMQLREASAERDFDYISPDLDLEDYKGRKRSLDTAGEIRTAILDNFSSNELDKTSERDVKEKHKANSRHRKKSRMNDRDAWTNKNDDTIDQNLELKTSCESGSFTETVIKDDDKSKSKKRKSKESLNISEESHINIDSGFETKKTDDSDIETLMLEVSQETLCPEPFHDSIELEIPSSKTRSNDVLEESNTGQVLEDNQILQVIIDHEKVENYIEDKNNTTDDELKGFESDLLVKDSSWSPEKSPERETYIPTDDKDSDKEVDKVKNDETTDKDSSDDCQPVVVKPDFKVNQKRGKNRKMLRKNREIESKVSETELNHDENHIKEGTTNKPEIISSKEVKGSNDIIPRDEITKPVSKLDSEEEDMFVEVKSDCFSSESFPNLKISDGVKRRIRKREPEKESELKDQKFPELGVPKRSWSSIVSLNCEDPNGNISKPEEVIAPVRSWSSIAAGSAKSKPQETEVVKTNSVEDRDSVYESCNDSVGEEVEPALDSLGSCYFELEAKNESDDPITVSGYAKEASSDSKNGSSVEDKSNTDSGEKEDLIVGIQTSIKKSKRQKKKKR